MPHVVHMSGSATGEIQTISVAVFLLSFELLRFASN